MKTATKIVLGFFAGAGVATALTVTAATKTFGEYGWHGDRSERMVNWIEHRLDLSPAQTDQLQQAMAKFKEMRSEWRDQRDEDLQLVRDLIASPTLDQAQVLALIESKADQVKTNAPEMIAAVATFSDSLSAEQKQEVVEMLEHRMDHHMERRMDHHHNRH